MTSEPNRGEHPSEPVTLREPVGSIKDLLKQCKGAFWYVFLITVVTKVLALTPLLFMMNMYDRVLASRSGITLVSILVVVLGILMFWTILEWLQMEMMRRVALRMDWELAPDAFDASFRKYLGRKKVQVNEVLRDLSAIRDFLTSQSLIAILSAPFAVIFIVIGGLFHPYLAIFSLVATALMLATAIVNKQITTPILKLEQETRSEAEKSANQLLRHSEAVYALGMQRTVRKRWYGKHKQFLQYQVNGRDAAIFVENFAEFLARAIPIMQMALAAFLAIEGHITGGMMIAATLLIGMSMGPLQALISAWPRFVAANGAYGRLDELLQEEELYRSQMSLPAPEGRLDVREMFAVPPGSMQPVLSNINFALQPGQVMAIVGPSGAGKTSLVRLLIGVWAPARGHVRLDGVDVAQWNHDELGPFMGYVPQEVGFFEGTVAENIARLGDIDSEKVVEACKLVDVHDAILALPKGYDTEIGDTGHALSGGMKQRLAIARAFYRKPKFLVLDEPNANLDDPSEQSLMKAIRTLKSEGCTIVFVSHRPKLLSVADTMLVIREGRQIGYGDTREMLSGATQRVANNPNPALGAA